jgi:isopenicillin N synthase-like dioxygenase
MELDIISYRELSNTQALKKIESALFQKGIVGVSAVPEFENKTRAFIQAARQFTALQSHIKEQYAPDRDFGDTEGYELGAEWFKDQQGNWQIDDKKVSYYAYVPDHIRNKWPREIDLKSSYLELGNLIFATGKKLLAAVGLDETIGLNLEKLVGYGRMLHYQKEGSASNANENWCGAHYDHGVFTGLVPAYYFQNDVEIEEPEEAGLYIKPNNADDFQKIFAHDKSILLFQVGEFGQLLLHDQIQATKHLVKKSSQGVERYTYALFHSADAETAVQSRSILNQDARYLENQSETGCITYKQWEKASYERYRAK